MNTGREFGKFETVSRTGLTLKQTFERAAVDAVFREWSGNVDPFVADQTADLWPGTSAIQHDRHKCAPNIRTPCRQLAQGRSTPFHRGTRTGCVPSLPTPAVTRRLPHAARQARMHGPMLQSPTEPDPRPLWHVQNMQSHLCTGPAPRNSGQERRLNARSRVLVPRPAGIPPPLRQHDGTPGISQLCWRKQKSKEDRYASLRQPWPTPLQTGPLAR